MDKDDEIFEINFDEAWGDLDDNDDDIEEIYLEAHAASDDNKKQLDNSKICACFCCGRVFETKIINWGDMAEDEHGTGICPFCGTDALLGDASGFPITPEFILKMQSIFFGSPFDEEFLEYIDERIHGKEESKMVKATIFFPYGDGIKELGTMEVDGQRILKGKTMCSGFVTVETCEDNLEDAIEYLKSDSVPYFTGYVTFVRGNELITNIYRLGAGPYEVLNGGKELSICFLDSAFESCFKNDLS